MRLKSIRGLQPHNFDIHYVHELIEKDSLERDDAITILNNAVTVIAELRGIVRSFSADLNIIANIMKEKSDSAMQNEVMEGVK